MNRDHDHDQQLSDSLARLAAVRERFERSLAASIDLHADLTHWLHDGQRLLAAANKLASSIRRDDFDLADLRSVILGQLQRGQDDDDDDDDWWKHAGE